MALYSDTYDPYGQGPGGGGGGGQGGGGIQLGPQQPGVSYGSVPNVASGPNIPLVPSAGAGTGAGTGTPNFAPPPYTGPSSASLPTVPTFNFPNFQAPTGVNYKNDPGYAFRLQQGENALQNSAAAQGVLNTGGTLEGILNYGQNYASQEYQNVYNRALQNYNANLTTQEQRFAPLMTQYGLQGQAAMQAYQNALQLYEFQQQAALQAQQQAQTPPAGL